MRHLVVIVIGSIGVDDPPSAAHAPRREHIDYARSLLRAWRASRRTRSVLRRLGRHQVHRLYTPRVSHRDQHQQEARGSRVVAHTRVVPPRAPCFQCTVALMTTFDSYNPRSVRDTSVILPYPYILFCWLFVPSLMYFFPCCTLYISSNRIDTHIDILLYKE